MTPFQTITGSGGLYRIRAADSYNSSLNSAGLNLYVPLQFWFNRNVGLSLPLIATQYHEVNININFSEVYGFSDTLGKVESELWCNYIYLDTDERRKIRSSIS